MTIIITLSLTGCKKIETQNQSNSDKSNAEVIIIDKPSEINKSGINEYKIEVELDIENMSYMGKQNTLYVNNTDIDLEEIYFHIYPNAFRTLEEAPILFNTADNIEALSYIPGYIEIEKVIVNNDNLKWNITGDKDTILNIKLKEPIKKGKSIELYLEYKVKLPTTKDRFGYHDNGINFGNWYPIACVYDKDKWNRDPYYKLGDPFYSETSNYQVSITVPKEIIVASSGNLVSEKVKGDKKTYNIEGPLLRDFAWAASEEFKIKEKIVDDLVIKVYSINDDMDLIDRSLDIGEKSIKTYNKIFGKYPYKQYSIVITEFPSGMEYPSIVFISNDFSKTYLQDILEKVIVHETAHQWWYGIVGNNQIDESWLDEALATYSEVIYTKEVYGKGAGEDYYDQNIKLGYEYAVRYLGENEIVNKPLSNFVSWDDYGLLVYTRGAMFIDRIKEEFGEEILYKILNSYYEKYKFRIATTEDFIKVCEEVTQRSFEPLVKEYLNGNK